MAGLVYVCPVGAQPGDIVVDSCPFRISQIQKLILQRKFSDNVSTRNSMTVANAALLATWSTLLSATDHTKVQITPYISNPETVPGEAIKIGGNTNETVDGIPIVTALSPTAFTALLRDLSAASKASLKAWFGENMGVYFVTNNSKIIGQTDSVTSPTVLYNIPIEQFIINDRKVGGLVDTDTNAIGFDLKPGWDDTLLQITPSDFDPLIALAGS